MAALVITSVIVLRPWPAPPHWAGRVSSPGGLRGLVEFGGWSAGSASCLSSSRSPRLPQAWCVPQGT